jgi:hypothetical protein
MGGKQNAYGVLVGKPKGKSPRGRPSCTWENTIKNNTLNIILYKYINNKMDLKETGLENVVWLHLAQDRKLCQALLNIVIKL